MLVISKTVKCFPMVGGLFVLVLTAGCSDPGARALLNGERLINESQYEKAVTQLQNATRLLPRNAQAWNHLGLAYHHQNEFLSARHAYVQALGIDYNLSAARFNLGCLLLENNDIPAAIDQLTSYALLQPRSLEGWLQLGTAQLRARRLDAAEKSFKSALEASPNNCQALNGLGNVQFYRRRNQEALAFFNRSLEQNPGYSPALLNAAVVTHQSLNRPLALQLYRKYLTHEPKAANADAVTTVANQLHQELNPPAAPVAVARAPVPAPVVKTNPPPAAVASPPPRLAPSSPVVTKPAPAPVVTSAPAKPPAKPAISETPIEVTRLPEDLTIKPVQDLTPNAARTNLITQAAANPLPATGSRSNAIEDKRGLLARLNPFAGKPRTNLSDSATIPPVKPAELTDASPSDFPKYKYLAPARPASGNRKEAQKHFTAGVKAQRSKDPRRALIDYQKAVELDPAYFEAHHNRGLAAYELGLWADSLKAFELALALQPDSVDARYNFALALKSANYVDDAIQQLSKVTQARPAEARAHLSLANLYAYRLNQPKLARPHFAKVLETEPRHPQAAEIRFWLASHPL